MESSTLSQSSWANDRHIAYAPGAVRLISSFIIDSSLWHLYYYSMSLKKKSPDTIPFSLQSILLIVVISVAVYANSVNNGFVYDDEFTITNNTLIRDIRNLHKLFQNEYFTLSGEMSYRPVVTLTYFFDYALYGQSSWGYHLTNVLLHALNGVLLYIFLRLLIERSRESRITNLPLLASLLFATNPALTEAVNAVSFREDLLTFIFYMATFNLYMALSNRAISRHRTIVFYVSSCVTYFLALFSKEMAATLPFVVYGLEWVYRDKKERGSVLFNRYNIGYIVITLIYLYLRFYYFRNPVEEKFRPWEASEGLLSLPWLLLSYLKIALFPVSLIADYEFLPLKSFFSPLLIVSSIAIVSLLIIAFSMKKKEKKVTFGIIFFVITLLPVYNLIPIYNPFAERYLYLPVVGLVIIVVGVAIKLVSGLRCGARVSSLSLFMLVFAILSLYSVATIKRNQAWRDDYTLWSDTIKKMPNNGRAHNNLGYGYYKIGQFDKAIEHFQTTIRLAPSNVNAHSNLGAAYVKLGRFLEAIPHLETAIELKPSDPKRHNELGFVYYNAGRLDEAIRHLQTAVRLDSNYFDAYNNLGIAYSDNDMGEEAMQAFQIALRLKPEAPDIWNNLGLLYYRQGHLDGAIRQYQASLKINPRYVPAHYNLGNAYLAKGLRDKARAEFEIALNIQPDFLAGQEALNNLEK